MRRSLPDDKLDFVGREEVLSKIGEIFTSGQSKIALVGLGGIGYAKYGGDTEKQGRY